jgi:4-hydroxy-tetrahydrodipicolinate reductase
MKIALIGDGKMARAISPLAIERGHVVSVMLGEKDNVGAAGISRGALGEPDVAIEFTEPSAAAANVMACARAGIPVVVGTTGWYDQLETVSAAVRELRGTMFWAPNFSLGVAAMSAAVEAVSRAIGHARGFDMHLVETHHSAKKDRPSGTAAALARVVANASGREVPITSIRTGHVPGTHELIIDGPYEQLRLVHEARDRRVFADGALAAAEWLIGREGVFTMRDMLQRAEAS